MKTAELEKQLTKLFNRYNISLNPTTYDLKSRVLLTQDLWHNHAKRMNKDLIDDITDKIGDSLNVIVTYKDYSTKGVRMFDNSFVEPNNINDFNVSILNSDNVYIDFNRIIVDMVNNHLAVVSSPKKKFDESVLKWALRNMHYYLIPLILMKSNKSLIDIIQGVSLVFKSDKVNDIRNQETLKADLKEVLDNKGTGLEVSLSYLHKCSVKVPRLISMDKSDEANWNFQSKDTTCQSMYRMSLITAIEIISNIYQCESLTESEKDEIISYLLEIEEADVYKEMFVNKCLYDYEKREFVEPVKKIIKCEDLNKRWEALNNYYHSISYNEADLVRFHTVGLDYFPRGIATLISTALEYSYKKYLYGYTLTLIEFCKKNAIDLSSVDTSEADVSMSGLANMMTSLDNIDDTRDSLGSLSKESYKEPPKEDLDKPVRKSSKVDQIRQSNEILDKALDFEEAKYNFRVTYRKTKVSSVSIETKNNYDKMVKATKLLNTSLIRSIKKIKTYNTGGKHSGLSKGKLDNKRLYLYKQTNDIFYNNTYKVKESDLAFAICLDASGSMAGDGIENGKITMVVLHETLKALGINHCIATHTSYRSHNVVIEKFQPFKEDRNYTIDKCYDLINIRAYSGNCDSGALYYMEKELSRVQNKDKICIMFSDGQPTECSGTELKEQVRHMEKNGIRVIGIGINYESIKEYYPHYANGKNLKQMLNIVADILKEYVLEKAE